jgi:hypothetical protein
LRLYRRCVGRLLALTGLPSLDAPIRVPHAASRPTLTRQKVNA